MVGDHAHPHVVVVVGPVGALRQFGGLVEHRVGALDGDGYEKPGGSFAENLRRSEAGQHAGRKDGSYQCHPQAG